MDQISKQLVFILCLQAFMPFLTAMIMLASRIRAVKARNVSIGYFRAFEGSVVLPRHLIVIARHYSNLFEMPMLFFIVSILFIQLKLVDESFVSLAWIFFGLRVIHSGIHLTYNNVTHRLVAFALSVLVLMVMWLRLLGKIF